jgi:Zn-dependent protease
MQGLLGTLAQHPLLFVITAAALVLSITVHEFAHAYVAAKLGDPTAKDLGRLSLNPLAHLDPLGTIALLLVGFGWGKAVPINYYNLANPKRDAALIALAGPGSNFLVAVGLAILAKSLVTVSYSLTPSILSHGLLVVSTFISPILLYNVVLGLFNLLPVEPLDGFKIVNGILPARLAVQWVQLAPYGLYILLALVVTGATSALMYPVVNLVTTILLP